MERSCFAKIKDKFGIAKENVTEETVASEKENVMETAYKPTWDLCIGVKGFVEDEREYVNGVVFEGME